MVSPSFQSPSRSIRRPPAFRGRYRNITNVKGSASAERQTHRKSRAAARLAGDIDRSAVGRDDRLDEAEAKAEAAFRAAAVAAKQTIPDPRLFVGRDADAGVANIEHGEMAVPPDVDIHSAAGRRVFDRVVDQIGGHLFQARAIADDNHPAPRLEQ